MPRRFAALFFCRTASGALGALSTLGALAVLALGCAGGLGPGAPPATASPSADRIYLGEIVTVDADGTIAEAVAVLNGRILLVGGEQQVLAHRGPQTEVVDLVQGAALLPGFIDAHSHLMAHGVPLQGWANLSRPPVGEVESIADLVAALKELAAEKQAEPGEWLIGYGYDREGLREDREITRQDLDPHFPDNPVMLVHVSSHGAVFNSAGLAAVRIDAATPDPPGGFIARLPGSKRPAGLVMEMAFFRAVRILPDPSDDEVLEALGPAQLHYAANGYTTIQDGATTEVNLLLLERAAAEGRLFLDVVALPDWVTFRGLAYQPDVRFGAYEHRLKLGGVKVVLDGSPQARTAFLTEPMLVPGPGGEKNWRGKPLISQADVDGVFRTAASKAVQTYTHANGDAAVDMFLAAYAAAGSPPNTRPVVIHSQFVRPEQLNAYKRIGAVPSFFTNHAFFWGDLHAEQLGQEHAYFLSPLRSASARGLRFTNHTDFAVTPLDPLFVLWTATERLSRSGVVIGPEERVSVPEALRALTIDAAYQYFEEAEKGSIEVGKLADFVILDANPVTTPSEALRDIRVLETIKEGETVWRAEE